MGAKPITLATKKWVLVGTALAPFCLSLIPTVYLILNFFYILTYPLCLLYGLLWCVMFHRYYKGAETQDRRQLRWMALLAVFAFVLPAHIILTSLGMPSLSPAGLAPP
jgi:hypothetical protein